MTYAAVAPLPITLLTGFLGAGKTHFLNHALKDPQFDKTLVLINEFGEVGLDHLLIDKIDGDMLLLSSGCLCCTIRGDLIATLEDVLKRKDNKRIADFNRVIIETTGLADPIPILQTLIQHPYLRLRFYLESVVTLIDAVNGHTTLKQHIESMKQAAVADYVLISKADLVNSAAALGALKKELAQINPSADIKVLDQGQIETGFIFNASLYNPETKSLNVQKWLQAERIEHHHHHDVNRHSRSIYSFCLRSEQPISPEKFEVFIEFLRQIYGAHMLRVKGLICLSDDISRPLLIHGVQHVFHPAVRLDEWPSDDHSTRIVFILHDLKLDFIQSMWNGLLGELAIDQADILTQVDNPLAIKPQGLLS